MPIKVVQNNAHPLNEEIKLADIQQLVDRTFERTRKRDSYLTWRNPMTKPHDSKSCWFSYAELRALFVENGLDLDHPPADVSKWGIRIYYGFHTNDNRFPTIKDPVIENQHTAVLVVTHSRPEYDLGPEIANLDCLEADKNFVSIAGAGNGVDNGMLCPPDTHCTGLRIS